MAQKTAAYDMYVRFYRWAADRLKEEGVIAFVTNRSFLDAQNLDGFRKAVENDFSDIWVYDLGGDVRSDPSLSGTKHNVFGIQTGVAICFLVKRHAKASFTVNYARVDQSATAEDKLSALSSASIETIRFTKIKPDKRGNWLNQSESDFETLLPVAKMPGGRNKFQGYIFELSSTGIMSGRDEWIYDFSAKAAQAKLAEFREIFQSVKRNADKAALPLTIKWSRNLKRKIGRVPVDELRSLQTEPALFRPFLLKSLPRARYLIDEVGALNQTFCGENLLIAFLSVASSHPVAVLATNRPFDYGLLKTGNGGTQGLYRYRYNKSGERVDNITNWAAAQFVEHYGEGTDITKDRIFAYCYAVLHDPLYREKYALNLKREFPRIPLYSDFDKWVEWGVALLKLHIDYEKVKATKLTRLDTPAPKRAEGTHPKAKLKSDAAAGIIVVDEDTRLTGVPSQAWEYRLGNRSAIDWVLDQHKEKTPRDPTIRAKFNTYRFSDYKESCIELLAKVVTVSIETVAITEAMKALDRSDWV